MHRRPEFSRIRAALARSFHFRDLSPEDLDRIAELGRLRRLRDGELAASASDISGDKRIELRVTQTDLARMLGASRSKVNAELKRLERDDLIKVGYRTITLVDVARLHELAGPDVFAF